MVFDIRQLCTYFAIEPTEPESECAVGRSCDPTGEMSDMESTVEYVET